MAIARIFDAPGWTPEQYDALIARMQLGGHTAPGVLFHWAAQTQSGMQAVDVYQSREVADRLVQEKIGPIAGELGLPLPQVTEFEVYATLTPAERSRRPRPEATRAGAPSGQRNTRALEVADPPCLMSRRASCASK